MKVVGWTATVLVVALVIVALVAPIGPMPGILIGGTSTDVPSSWGNTESVLEIDLQVGAGPFGRTVTIWTVQVDGDLYVTGQKDSGWTQGIANAGPVRMQMGGNLYELNATRITQDEVSVLTAWQAKYLKHYPDLMEQFDQPDQAIQTAAVFKLAKRG